MHILSQEARAIHRQRRGTWPLLLKDAKLAGKFLSSCLLGFPAALLNPAGRPPRTLLIPPSSSPLPELPACTQFSISQNLTFVVKMKMSYSHPDFSFFALHSFSFYLLAFCNLDYILLWVTMKNDSEFKSILITFNKYPYFCILSIYSKQINFQLLSLKKARRFMGFCFVVVGVFGFCLFGFFFIFFFWLWFLFVFCSTAVKPEPQAWWGNTVLLSYISSLFCFLKQALTKLHRVASN